MSKPVANINYAKPQITADCYTLFYDLMNISVSCEYLSIFYDVKF